MKDKYRKSLFLFRRDLRVRDNSGLIEASAASETVIPAFIFDPSLGSQNPYFSHNAFQFMVESLHDLARQVAAERGFLCVFHGRPERVVEGLTAEEDIEAVFVNTDSRHVKEVARRIASLGFSKVIISKVGCSPSISDEHLF